MSLLEDPMHPGDVLKVLFLSPLALGAIAVVRHLGVPRNRIERLIRVTTGISADTALRLAGTFNLRCGIEFCMNYIRAKPPQF
jgi:addiction module HigA family antidote